MTTRKRTPKPPTIAARFVAVTGSPFSDEDAQVIGAELLRIAEDNKVEGIRSLDKHLVAELVEKDKHSPLRKFYEWDIQKAARKHWVERSAQLIRSVRVVTVSSTGRTTKPQPIFVYAGTRGAVKDGVVRRRGHVLRNDALADDPLFMGALGVQIRRIVDAVKTLEGFTAGRNPPIEIARLRDQLRAVLDEYASALTLDAAAQ